MGHSISNFPSRYDLKVQGMEYDISKNTNVSALVHHIELVIKLNGVFMFSQRVDLAVWIIVDHECILLLMRLIRVMTNTVVTGLRTSYSTGELCSNNS